MAVTIRLSRMGRHKRPYYRIVATDSRFPRQGRFLEIVGTYDPLAPKDQFNVKREKIKYWLGKGAQMSDTVRSIFHQAGLFKKTE